MESLNYGDKVLVLWIKDSKFGGNIIKLAICYFGIIELFLAVFCKEYKSKDRKII
ncbi:hypothetical protein [Campylobacter portucalensis]|uniref:hypothetical protein n=1 Tax=Campylobacter portucalensis TaxID=2608384 RepID=UPI0012B232B1|nr:hypothetical protein [Campylobacter portucalensis]